MRNTMDRDEVENHVTNREVDIPLFVTTRVLIVAFFIITGAIGNGFVLFVYIRNKSQSGRTFVILLALLNLSGCISMLPQTPFWELGLLGTVLDYQIIFYLMANVFIQIGMSFDRLFAVFTPFRYKVYRRRSLRCVVAVFICCVFGMSLLLLMTGQSILLTAIFFGIYFLGLVIVICSYPIIAFKLYLQNRKIKPSVTVTTITNGSQLTTQEANKNANVMHVKTLKVYVAILVLFLVTLSASVLAVFMDRSMGYIFYFNNVCNPGVYYILVEKFRAEVKKYCPKLLCGRSTQG